MERGKIFLSVLAGVAAGSLIGILFAPDKGTETRKKIVHKGEEYVDNLKEKVTGILRNGEKRHETVTETAAWARWDNSIYCDLAGVNVKYSIKNLPYHYCSQMWVLQYDWA